MMIAGEGRARQPSNVVAVIRLRTLDFSPLSFSPLLTTSGIAGLVGATVAPRIGRRFGVAAAIAASSSLRRDADAPW